MKIKELLSVDYYVIALAIVLGSLIIAIAIIGSGPRYQAVANSGAIAVIDTRSGKFIFYNSCIPVNTVTKSITVIPR